MADEETKMPLPAAAAQTTAAAGSPGAIAAAQQTEEPAEHYEEVAEYRIGEGPPPLPLIISFVLIVAWATIAWIPFFGY